MQTKVQLTQMTSDVLLQTLRVNALAQEPSFTWGSPGIGKSDVHQQLADSLNAPLIDLRASQWDAVDTRGIPFVDRADGAAPTTRWAVPDVFPSAEYAAKHEWVVLFLDELNLAAPSVQSALYQLILSRRLGDYVLPDNVVLFAAGNLETDRSGVHRMSQALADRFFHYQLIVDNLAWEKWALENDLHVATIAYNRWRPQHLHDWDAKSVSKAQATPRSWYKVSKVLKIIEAEGINGQVEAGLVTGKIGESVGAEFIGFLKIYRNLPDPDGVILAPDAAPVSEDPAVSYALCGALAERATDGNIDRIIQYAERLQPEFMTLLIRSAAVRHPEVQSTKGFMKWASKNADVLIK